MTDSTRRVRPVIELRNVEKTYGEGETVVHAVAGVSLEVERGDYVAVMGASGSGKSTLMNIIGCLDLPSRGAYRLDGIDVRRLVDRQLSMIRNRKIGFIFQSFNLITRTTALMNVELPLAYANVPKAQRRARAIAALERVGMGDRLGHTPAQLSGGQQQRVAIARAIVSEPVLLLADEPTGALDSHSTVEVLRPVRRTFRGRPDHRGHHPRGRGRPPRQARAPDAGRTDLLRPARRRGVRPPPRYTPELVAS